MHRVFQLTSVSSRKSVYSTFLLRHLGSACLKFLFAEMSDKTGFFSHNTLARTPCTSRPSHGKKVGVCVFTRACVGIEEEEENLLAAHEKRKGGEREGKIGAKQPATIKPSEERGSREQPHRLED